MSNYPWLKTIEQAYGLSIAPSQIQKFGGGHIHATFLVDIEGSRYILQQFNQSVFQFPERISHNQALVLRDLDRSSLSFQLPLPIVNLRGELFTKTENSLFRLSPFVFGDCVNQVKSEEQAFLAAKAFAELIIAGKDVDPNALQEVIPDFHNLEFRYQQLEEALSETKLEIKGELKDLVDFYLGQYSLVEEYLEWKKILPRRLTHNDTKINNLIFSEDGSKVNAVIDLDTLMAGYVFFDFGDLVRTVACTEEESSTDWENISFDQKKYKGLYAGFAEAGKDFFTREELDSLPFGGLMMTYIMGLRFLADYLRGNMYYTTHYPDQNLHRAKNQMILLKAMSNLKQS
ncbi:hypothetical protein P872_05575 [Rhodonellum psychrophilum GCM71 = DSM 17998]|uniref:Aminoglycoside phosphotransferase domain-containing protein n=2 Tax=Rhodonellum TaxID=336827 RepID=U5C410_9BACT|nr:MULTISPECIES: aminoglycoside phosphotransferase family protein [Rhodonellum]ERM82917.1 hypothetical protein P872_05575 [Rhodonellum psychrophilum GCM71 = DSM 17998]SDY48122.1 Ser/Thr protein kinase RdoA involved in Cpx stress response, MazF antagonist [Rhodonellum ikkaensis]